VRVARIIVPHGQRGWRDRGRLRALLTTVRAVARVARTRVTIAEPQPNAVAKTILHLKTPRARAFTSELGRKQIGARDPRSCRRVSDACRSPRLPDHRL
jgi:hypothetical protein